MFKQVVGAVIGSQLAKKSPIAGGATGIAISTAIPFIVSRFSIPAMIVLGVGSYAAKRYLGNKKDGEVVPPRSSAEKLTPVEAPKTATGSVINPPPGGAAN
jgi:hypothetical protein